ncbi:MAG: EamA family transporter [Myxococcota bacterium]
MGLDPVVTALVLLAAVMHAGWNAVTKSSPDRTLTLGLVLGTSAVFGLVACWFVPIPAPASHPFLLVSACFHLLYQIFLLQAYRFGDLSHVYPIARGLAPVLVALFAALFAAEAPDGIQALGLGVASASITSLALEPRTLGPGVTRSVVAALVTAAMIGTYTFLDGQGVRRAGDAYAYIAWNLWLTSLPFCLFVLLRRRARLAAILRTSEGLKGIVGGITAMVGYAIVLWAMDRGAMASVAALRETSVVFAALIGTMLLGEAFGARRILAALGVALGVILLQSG